MDSLRLTFSIIRREPKLLFFPLLSALLLAGILLSFISPAHLSTDPLPVVSLEAVREVEQQLGGGRVFLFLILTYLLLNFSNAGVVAGTFPLLKGKPVRVLSGLELVLQHSAKIIRWTLISATIGVALRYLGSRSREISRILFPPGRGVAWNRLTYFALPVMLIEGKDVHHSLQRSQSLIHHGWKKALPPRLIGGYGFLLIAPGLALLIYGLFANSLPWKVIAVSYLALVSLILSTLSMVFRTVLYGTTIGYYGEKNLKAILVSSESTHGT